MKVTVFFTFGISLQKWNEVGLLQREVRIYKELMNKNNIEFQFVTYGDETDKELQHELIGIEILPLYSKSKKPKNFLLQFFKSLLIPFVFRKELSSSNLYKTNQILGGWVAVISKFLYRKPLIARCGYEIYDFSIRADKGMIYKSFIYLTSLFTYFFSNRVHVAKNSDKSFVIDKFHINPKKIHIYPNWIDMKIYKNLESHSKKNRILCVGRLNNQKNLSMLIDALEETNIAIDIVGSGELYHDLFHQAKANNVEVNFLRNLSNLDMPALYNEYSVYVISSHYEGNPKTLLEAMACGCAVIGTDVAGINDVINHNYTGLLVAKNKSSLKNEITSLISDTKLQEKLGKNAAIYIQNNNSLASILDKEIKAYNESIINI